MRKAVLFFFFLLLASPAYGIMVGQGGLGISNSATDYTQDANCQGAWYMNNNGGNETDRSVNGETLTQDSGTIPTSSTVPSGYSGTSRDFERGDTEALYHADGGSTDISGSNMSAFAWIKFEADPSADAYIMDKYGAPGTNQYTMRHDSTQNGIEVALSSDGTASTSAFGATNLADDTDWHHVGYVYDGSTITIYVDGAVDTNGANNPKTYSSGIFNGSNAFVLGNSGLAASDGFDGLIDEAIIFDRALTAQEVAYIYNNGIDGSKGGND